MDSTYQLNLKTLLERTVQYFPNKEIVSRETNGNLYRYNYQQFNERVKKLGSVLKTLGIQKQDKVGTLAWNTHRHLELFMAVPCYGAALHSVNIRYGVEEIIYTINHSKDKILFFDEDVLLTVEAVSNKLKSVEAYVVLSDSIPKTNLTPIYNYEELLNRADENFEFDTVDEDATATICYTSATTGNPKGVAYTHRSLHLYSSLLCHKDVTAISETDCILPIVPLYHVNSWGYPYAAIATGAKIVLPGVRPNVHDFLKLIESEKVTFTTGAVTIGIEMLNVLENNQQYEISSLRALHLGGQATPKAVIEKFLSKYNIPIVQGYGATETSPLVTFTRFRKDQENMSFDEKVNLLTRQGVLVPGVEMKIIDKNGNEVKWNDKDMGEIYLRGPWIINEYIDDERSKSSFENGWWKSGDIATIDRFGSIKLVDRDKDMIKSGGEWISSVRLENELMNHPYVNEACVIAIPHEKWLERPVAYVVLKENISAQDIDNELTKWLESKLPKWWLPDQYIYVNEIPKNANGKFNKKKLREEAKRTIVESTQRN